MGAEKYSPVIIGVEHTNKNLNATLGEIDFLAQKGMKSLGLEREVFLTQSHLNRIREDNEAPEEFKRAILALFDPHLQKEGFFHIIAQRAKEKGVKIVWLESPETNEKSFWTIYETVKKDYLLKSQIPFFNITPGKKLRKEIEIAIAVNASIISKDRTLEMKRIAEDNKLMAICTGTGHAISLANSWGIPLRERFVHIYRGKSHRPPLNRWQILKLHSMHISTKAWEFRDHIDKTASRIFRRK